MKPPMKPEGAESLGATSSHADIVSEDNQINPSSAIGAASGAVCPAESRAFSLVEMVLLVAGFALAARVMTPWENWRSLPAGPQTAFTLLYLASGLSLSGPIVVSWRERLGRRRPIWGLGESLWFAFGILVQNGCFTLLLGELLGSAAAVLGFVLLILLLPAIYLTGNPRIEWSRAPGSWSNLVGLLSMALWFTTLVGAVWLAG